MTTKKTPRERSKRAKCALVSDDAAWDRALTAIAGGFAHDANNCLTGIFSMSELCLAQVEPQNPVHESLTLIRESAQQASQLLQRLTRLVYDAPGSPSYHDLNAIVSETLDILRRVLGRNLELAMELSPGQLPVFVDAVELRRVIIYLALNAAASIASRAKLLLRTAEIHPGMVQLSVAGTVDSATPIGEHSVQRLRLAEEFAVRHGGRLRSASVKGSNTVELSLPRAQLE